ncbi:MAG: translation initiation factor IF-2 subunit beta [Nanoarchaeota archaeon]|nr:translation initiation factor IF-2 subunit beta [Nanoarchaeota archaeon]MCG2718438.1 translation initiation factor IF-2 subunit beta [Nanoarchaeota archaeon]
MKFDYKDLLKKGRKELPESVKSTGERFEIPKVKGHLEGNKTIISNFFQIADALHREHSHLLKFLQRELATPAKIEGQRLVLGRKLPASLINAKIQLYANTFVICLACKKPDTNMLREGKALFLRCMACGAKQIIKAKI